MNSADRQKYLKIAVGVVVGLFLLDRAVLGPIGSHWTAQSERIEALREKVKRGNALRERQESLRSRWDEMLRGDLPAENTAAEDEVYKAVNRWVRDSRIAMTSIVPAPWRTLEGYEVYECRATATGDQASLSRFIYELETDPLPVRVEDCEFSTRDKTGKQLSLTMRFTFVRLSESLR